MFVVIKTYTCNGCSATATEDKAKKWTHLNNNLIDGKQNMDFCPNCTKLLHSVLAPENEKSEPAVTTFRQPKPVETPPGFEIEKTVAPFGAAVFDNTPSAIAVRKAKRQNMSVTDISELESTNAADDEPAVENSVETVEESEHAALDVLNNDETAQYIDFYNQLYARILYDIACDSTDDSITTYAPFIPGKVVVDTDSTEFGNRVTLKFNNKRLVIIYDTDKPTSAEIKVCRGKRVLYTRKVSKFSAVQSFVTDLAKSDMNFLPEHAKACSAEYIKAKMTAIDKGILNGIDLQDLKSWIKFIAEQLGIES